MKPRLLRSDATAFDNLGFGALTHTISCIVKEELGVAPTLETSLLNDDPNFVNVEVGNIIAVEPNKNDPIQAFVIEEISKPIDGIVTIYATHIAQHRGKLIPVAPFTATDLDTALSLMVSSSLESNPFTLVRDEGKNNVTATMHPTVPHSFRELMGGVEGSILDTYRGEWKYDNFTLTLYNKRGRDNGVRVMYGRNMSDFKLEEQFNWDGSATGVIGYWVNSEDGTTVIGDIQYSDYASLYPYKKTVCMDFSDKWENQPSVTDLNTYALSWINGKGLYGASVTVAFEHLNVEGGADIGLGDTVHIFNGTYNFEMESRIVGLEYDVLAEEYTSVTIGEQRTTLNEAIADIGGGSTSSGGGGGGSSVDPSTTLPLMDGTASVGTEQTYARGDHVHPTDTSRLGTDADINLYGLMYRGNARDYSTDFNNIKLRGMYILNGTAMTNAPEDPYQWAYLWVIHQYANDSDQSGFLTQFIFRPNGSMILMRDLGGAPATWGAWRAIIADNTKSATASDLNNSNAWTSTTLYSNGGTERHSLTINKLAASTKLKVSMSLPLKTTNLTSRAMVFVDGAQKFYLSTNGKTDDSVVTGVNYISGLAAGSHTISLRIGVQAGGVTATLVAYRPAFISVEEV